MRFAVNIVRSCAVKRDSMLQSGLKWPSRSVPYFESPCTDVIRSDFRPGIYEIRWLLRPVRLCRGVSPESRMLDEINPFIGTENCPEFPGAIVSHNGGSFNLRISFMGRNKCRESSFSETKPYFL